MLVRSVYVDGFVRIRLETFVLVIDACVAAVSSTFVISSM